MSSYKLKKNINTYDTLEVNDSNIELSSDGYRDKVIKNVNTVTKSNSSVFSTESDRLLLLISGLYSLVYSGLFIFVSLDTILFGLLTVLLIVGLLFIVATLIYNRLYGMLIIDTGSESVVIKNDKEKIDEIYRDISNNI